MREIEKQEREKLRFLEKTLIFAATLTAFSGAAYIISKRCELFYENYLYPLLRYYQGR